MHRYETKHSPKIKNRLPARICQPLRILTAPNQIWCIDFMCETLSDGSRF